MQSDNSPKESNMSQKQIQQWREYVSDNFKRNDQQNIQEIIKKHPYKKWEDIENNGTVTN